MPTVREIIRKFEQRVPKSLAMGKDPIGLHFGDWNQEVRVVMTTLDIRPSIIQEAIEKNVDLIIAHHPPIFRPVQQFDLTNPQHKMYQEILKHDIAIYAAHTNLDVVSGGVNDWLSEVLQLEKVEVLSPTGTLRQMKIAVFVPKEQASTVRQAMHEAGAGQIGDCYKECSFTTSGVGRFTPTEGANPAIGQVNQAEEAAEEKVEVICYENQVDTIITAMKASHPYEVPAYEVWALENDAKTLGIGRIGQLPEPLSVEEFVTYVKNQFQLKGLRFVTPRNRSLDKIRKVAVLGGSGGSFYQAAVGKGADAFVTGDITYHVAHDIQESPMLLVDAGHHIEVVCIEKLANWLVQWNQEENWNVSVIKSTIDTDPFEFL